MYTKDNVLIGMGAIVMDNCIIEAILLLDWIVVLEGTHVDSGCICWESQEK